MDAFHLPGWNPRPDTEWRTLAGPAGGPTIRAPVLAVAEIDALVGRILDARAHLLERPVMDVVHAIDAAAARLDDPDGPYRPAAARYLPGMTGYAPPMIDLVLRRMISDWRAPALHRLLRAEFGDPDLIDALRQRAAAVSLARAFGPALSFHIFAGNVPGVAVTSIVRALLVKSAVIGKTAAGEPVLPVLFAHSLSETAPWLAECLAVTYWPGGDARIEEPVLRSADLIVVYGSEQVLADVRRRAPPDARLVEHGPRLSLGLVARDALSSDRVARQTAAEVARAVATFDQQGCVSPHVVYAEHGGAVTPRQLAELVARQLEEIQRELPRGAISDTEAAAIQALRARSEFRAAQDPELAVHAPAGTEFTVVYDPDPAFAGSCLNRFLWIKPLADASDLTALLAPFARVIQTVAVAGLGHRINRLAGELGACGASRITSFAAMPWPPPHWHHDGAEPLRELIRWLDVDVDVGGDAVAHHELD